MMTIKSVSDILGFEYDWLASDAAGNVGFFSTGGGGCAPDGFLRDTDAHERAIDAVLALAAHTEATCVRQLPRGLRNTWQMMAERGFFAFDADPNGGPYKLVARPGMPTRVSELPDGVATVVRRLTYPHLRFADLTELRPGMLQQPP